MGKPIGRDLVGKFTALGAVAARNAPMEVLGHSLISNLPAEIAPHPSNLRGIDWEELRKVAIGEICTACAPFSNFCGEAVAPVDDGTDVPLC